MEQKVLLCILMFLTACEYDDLGIGTQPIDSKIIIETREVLGAESRLLTFQCKTEKSYTYWGTIKYLTPETTDKVNKFLQQLRDSGADFSKQEPGHYFYYEIDENGDIISDAQGHGSRFVQAFVFQHYGDEEEFREEFRALALPYHRDMSIYMETYRGKTVNNWTRE